MKQAVPQTTHEFDQFGYLVRLPDETDADYATRTASVLHQTGMSPNTPADVEAQYDAEEPILEMNEGEDPAAFAERQKQAKEEWGKENARLREEALATERSKEEERRSHLAGPQPHEEEEEEEVEEHDPVTNTKVKVKRKRPRRR